jgi:serine protease Do
VLSELANDGAAKEAGLKLGDIIIKVNDRDVNSKSEFEEEMSYHYPADRINLTYLRDGKAKTVSVMLVNKNGDTNFIKRKIFSDATLGVNLEAVEYGVKIYKIKDGLFKRIGLPENYTIMSINRRRVKDPQEVIDFFNKYQGDVLIDGFTSAKERAPIQFRLK